MNSFNLGGMPPKPSESSHTKSQQLLGLKAASCTITSWYHHSLLAVFLATVLLVGCYAYGRLTLQVLQKNQQAHTDLRDQVEELHEVYGAKNAHQELRASNLKAASYRQACLVYYLESIAAVIPSEARLDTLNFKAGPPQICLVGTAQSLESLTSFFKQLRYETVQKEDTITEIKHNKQKNGQLKFELSITLNQ